MSAAHCWTDRMQWLEDTYGRDSDDYNEVDAERWHDDKASGWTCMLPDKHEGPHVWTNDDEIKVRFI